MLIYLLKKCGVKVLNRGLIVPPPKINLMMRNYRTETIGHIKKTTNNPYLLKTKIEEWKIKFSRTSEYYPCIY